MEMTNEALGLETPPTYSKNVNFTDFNVFGIHGFRIGNYRLY